MSPQDSSTSRNESASFNAWRQREYPGADEATINLLRTAWFAHMHDARALRSENVEPMGLGERLRQKGYADVPLGQQPSELRQLLANARASETYRKEAAELESAHSAEVAPDRDKDWILAMASALGTDSGFEVPIVPEVEPFRRLFAAIRSATAPSDWAERLSAKLKAASKGEPNTWGFVAMFMEMIGEVEKEMAATDSGRDTNGGQP